MTTQNRRLCNTLIKNTSPVRVHCRRHHRRHHPVHATRSSSSRTRNKALHLYPRRRRNIRIRRRRRCYHLGRYRKKKRQHLRISRRLPQRCRSIIHGILSFEPQQQDTTHRNNAAIHRSREVRRHTYIQQECNGKTQPHSQTKNGEEIGGELLKLANRTSKETRTTFSTTITRKHGNRYRNIYKIHTIVYKNLHCYLGNRNLQKQ